MANEEGLNLKVQNNLVGTIIKKNNLSKEQVDKIIDLILNTSMSYRKIARENNIELNTIICIKNGSKRYRRNNLKYPLRKNN